MRIILFFFILCCVSCESTTNQHAAAEKSEKYSALIPTEVIDSLDLAVFDYQGISPIFDYRDDTTYVINFWATWCKPCVKELPYFEQLTKEYADKPLKVILVSLDFRKQLASKYVPFLSENNIQSKALLMIDPKEQDWIDKVDPEWGGSIPATVVYRGEARTFMERTFKSFEELETIVKQIIIK